MRNIFEAWTAFVQVAAAGRGKSKVQSLKSKVGRLKREHPDHLVRRKGAGGGVGEGGNLGNEIVRFSAGTSGAGVGISTLVMGMNDGLMQPLSGLMTISDVPQGRTVRAAEAGRFYPGLDDTIPSGLAVGVDFGLVR
jgi:hypothetical protein